MFEQMQMRSLGQPMTFQAPQMGPSMSPGFVFAATQGPRPVNIQPSITTPLPLPLPLPLTEDMVPPTVRYQDVLVPVGILAGVALIIGLTV